MFGEADPIPDNLDDVANAASRAMIQDMTVFYPVPGGLGFTTNHAGGINGRHASIWLRHESVWDDGILTQGHYRIDHAEKDDPPEDSTAGVSIAFYDGHAQWVDVSQLEDVGPETGGPQGGPWDVYSVFPR